MQFKQLKIGWMALNVLILSGLGGCASFRSTPSGKNALVPDERTRAFARQLRPDDVVHLRFDGGNFGLDSTLNPIEVTDKRLISRFLEALRQAEVKEYLELNRPDMIAIQLHTPLSGHDNPIRLPFRAGVFVDSFGKEFERCVQELGPYQADKVRTAVQQLAPQVKYVEITGLYTVRDKAKVQEIVDDLQNLDAHAFQYTSEHEEFWITLHLNSGEKKTYNLVVGPYDSRIPPKSQTVTLLPTALWGHFLKAQEPRKSR